jgi:putative ABC transport system permease protein
MRPVKWSPLKWVYTIPPRVRSLLRGGAADAEVDEELRDYLERQTEENLRRGMSAEQARRAALVALGGTEQRKQQMREARGVSWMGDIGRDVQYGVRTMLRRPGFTVTALLMLALGIGANTAIFSADHAVLFRKLPYQQPGRLVELMAKSLSDPGVNRMYVAPANYYDWQADTKPFSEFAAWRIGSLNLSGGDHPERVRAAHISANLLDVLGVEPMLGRGFRSGEDTPGASNVAILSYALWQRRYAGDPGIVGRTIRVNDQIYTVAGVMAPEFRFPIGWIGTDVEIWTPLALTAEEKASRKDILLEGLARLRPGVTVRQAQLSLDGVAQELAKEYPETNRDWGVYVFPLADRGVSDMRELLTLLSVAVGLVLMIACANVANLLLARGVERQKELMVRAALGARRARLVRQLITEGVLLSLFGGLLGIGLGYAGTWALASMAPVSELPELKHVSPDGTVLAVALGVALLTGFLFSVLPALTVSGVSLHGTLQEVGRASTGTVRGHRVKMALVAGEVALTLALLLCAGDIANSFLSYMRIDPGFDARDVLTMRLSLPKTKYAEPQQWMSFFNRAVEEMKTIPGVTDAAVGSGAPMEDQGSVQRFHVAGKPPGTLNPHSMNGQWIAEYERVTPDYFRVTGIGLERGRGLLDSDLAGHPPVAVVNATFAKKQFGGEDPIGKRIYLDGDVNESATTQTAGTALTVVGVIQDTKEYGLFQITPQMVFVPMAQDPETTVSLLVKTAPGAGNVLPPIRERLAKMDADEPVYNARSLEELFRDQHALFRFNTMLLTVFAVAALLLSAIGIYGVIAYAVSQRRREFGIRLALGSSRQRIRALVLRQAGWMSCIGIAVGLMLAWPSTRLLAHAMHGSMNLTLARTGLVLYPALCAGMVATMVLGCLVPAHRATQVDPMETLRGD